VKLGPAPADEVLASLLQGSRFDYVILGQPENPHTVERVLLSIKSGIQGTQTGAIGGQPTVNSQQPPNEVVEEASEEETVEQPQQPIQQQPIQQPVVTQPVPSPGISGVPTAEELANRIREQQQKQGLPIQGPNNTAPLKRPPLPQ
jgi:hypothetical protein